MPSSAFVEDAGRSTRATRPLPYPKIQVLIMSVGERLALGEWGMWRGTRVSRVALGALSGLGTVKGARGASGKFARRWSGEVLGLDKESSVSVGAEVGPGREMAADLVSAGDRKVGDV